MSLKTKLAMAAVIFALAIVANEAVKRHAAARIEVDRALGRIESIKEAQGKRDEIEALSDDGLLQRLGRWVLQE